MFDDDREQLVYTPADPEELEKKRKTEGMTVGCRSTPALSCQVS